MKDKLIFASITIVVLVLTFGLQQYEVRTKQDRTHQHLESNWQGTNIEDSEEPYTHLPIIMIDTRGQRIPGAPLGGGLGTETSEDGKTEITSSLSVIDLQKGRNSIEDKPTLESLANIRYRGNSSRHFDKKSYKVDLVFENGDENKVEMLGMSIHDEWVLNGPFLDRTLMRNYLAMNLAGEIMDYAPNVRYCELYVDGDYKGVYLLMENITKGRGRVNIKKPDKNSRSTDYVIRLDREGKGKQQINDYSFYSNRHADSAINIIYPGQAQMTDARKEYIEADISKFEKAIYSYDLSDKEKGYIKYIDLDEFADFFIINEFFGDSDAGRFSTFYYKSARGKLKPSVWDFNNSSDNYIEYPKDETKFSMLDIPVFDALIKDEKFIDTVVARYRSHRKGVLSEDYLLNYLDETNLWLGDAVDRNYEKWGYIFDLSNYDGMNYLTPVDRNYTSHSESVKQLKRYIKRRGKWLDEHITSLYQYTHKSRNINELLK